MAKRNYSDQELNSMSVEQLRKLDKELSPKPTRQQPLPPPHSRDDDECPEGGWGPTCQCSTNNVNCTSTLTNFSNFQINFIFLFLLYFFYIFYLVKFFWRTPKATS